MSGGGTLLAFEVAGGKTAAFRMANALSIIGISNNLGDAKSLITHPETTTHQRLKPEQRAALAAYLERHPKVEAIAYPGLASHPQAALAKRQMEAGGTMLSFEVAGGKAAAFRVANALSIIGVSNNLGDAKSLITHPATTTHQRLKPEQLAALNIGPGLLRLSIGLEDTDDLIEDLAQALDKASAPQRHAAE